MTTPKHRLIAYAVVLLVGVGLLIYGVESEAESVREIAAGMIGLALGGAGLRQVRQ